MKRGNLPSLCITVTTIPYTWKKERVSERTQLGKNEKEKERKRVVFRSVLGPIPVYYTVGVCVYSGRSLVEAMPSQQRPLSTPDTFNPLVRQPFVSALAPRPSRRERERHVANIDLYTRIYTHTRTGEACTQRLTLSFAPWGRPLSNRKPQRATALIKRAIDRHYR